MHAKISGKRLKLFRPMLTAGLNYSVSEFDVAPCARAFTLSDSPFMICFTDLTTFEELTHPVSAFPEEGFMFCNEAALLGLANTNSRIPDIVSEITALKSTVREPLKGKNHVMATIKLENGGSVTLSLFDAKAISFHRRIGSMAADPRVIVATNINPVLVGGRLFVNATSWTNIYFDGETSVGQNRMFRYSGVQSAGPLLGGTPVLEVYNIADVKNIAMTSLSEEFHFMCIGKVSRVHADRGWCFVSCSKCSRELRCTLSAFTCARCENMSAVGVLRYRVELAISDAIAEGVFICYDGVMTHLHNVEADAAAEIMVGERVNGEVSRMPPFITEMEGKIYVFHARLSTSNLSASRETFVVTRILGELDHVPLAWINENRGGTGPVRIALLDHGSNPLET